MNFDPSGGEISWDISRNTEAWDREREENYHEEVNECPWQVK